MPKYNFEKLETGYRINLKKVDFYEYTVATVYLSALINADRTGLTDDDVTLLESFLDDIDENYGQYQKHWTCNFSNSESFFAVCDICGLGAECSEVELVVFTGQTY